MIITLITLKLKIGSSANIYLYVTILRLIHHESINHFINLFTIALTTKLNFCYFV